MSMCRKDKRVEEKKPEAVERSDENLRALWNEIFDLRIVNSLRFEEDDNLLKTAMLNKLSYWRYKALMVNSCVTIRNQSRELDAKEMMNNDLMAEIKRLRSLLPENVVKNKATVDVKIKVDDLLNHELGITPLPVRPESSGVKRLSSEGQSEEQAGVKKPKVEISGEVDYFKEDKLEPEDFFVPETIENEDEPVFLDKKPAQYIPETLDESQDIFQESICVLRENSPKSKSPGSPTTPKSPILSSNIPKSPIILTARTRRNLFENRENHSPRSSPGSNLSFGLSPAKQLSKKSVISSPVKTSTPLKVHSVIPSPVKSALLSPIRPSCEPSSTKSKVGSESSTHEPSPVKTTVTQSNAGTCTAVKPSPGKESFVKPAVPVRIRSPVKTIKGKENTLDMKFESNQAREVKSKVSALYLGGRSKLEVTPHDKPVKPVKMKQSKLSLSMFQGKKTVKSCVVTDDQLLQQALQESLKMAQPLVDSQETFFEPDLGEETFYQSHEEPVTFFEEEVDTTKQSPVTEEKAVTSRQHHNSNFLNITTWNQMPENTTSSKSAEVPEDDNVEKYFSDSPIKVAPRPLNTLEREFVQGYDKVPSKEEEGPGYVYKGEVVRKKQERQQLPGWECHECKGFNSAAGKNCDSQERREMMNCCSRHRQAAPLIGNTPPGIWEIGLLKSQHGATQVGKLEVRRKPKGRQIDKAVNVTQTPGDLL